jgi:YD repeat-containing protein
MSKQDTSRQAMRAQRRMEAYERAKSQLARSFDPEVGLCVNRTELAARHIPRTSLDYARCLLRDGGAEDAALAAKIIERCLEAQEQETGHPHHGGFRFALEDEEVTGLNVTSFVLLRLLAIWNEHGDRLPETLRDTLRRRVRWALAELARVDVALRYTNPALMDSANTILWGEVLAEPELIAAGKAKFDAWVAFTAGAGAPYEYNSPGYVAIDLTVLATLVTLSRDPDVRLKARLMEERLWLHAVLHFHDATGQIAGPHSRAYHGGMHGGAEGVYQLLWQELGLDLPVPSPYLDRQPRPSGFELALTTYHCPPHIAAWVQAQASHYPYEVREVADRASSADLATYCTPSFALGTASRTYTIGQGDFDIEHEGNHCILHYRHSSTGSPAGLDRTGWRTLYTRFVLNERYLGTIEQHAIRSKRTNFYDQGLFAGHQDRSVAIALYGLELQNQGLYSVELLLVMPGPVRPRGLHVVQTSGEVAQLPPGVLEGQISPVPENVWIVVDDGDVWAACWPLARDQMGKRHHLEVRTLPTGELVLAIPHYRGPEKWFWEYASPAAAFYRRNIRSGVILVVGDRKTYATLDAFATHLSRAAIADDLDPSGVRTVGYRNADADLAMRYDLAGNRTVERRLGGQRFTAPSLSSPIAVQVQGEVARLADATLEAAGSPAVLIVSDAGLAAGHGHPSSRVWEAMILSDGAHPVRLHTPAGDVSCDGFGFGSIRVRSGGSGPPAVEVRCTRVTAPITLPLAAFDARTFSISVGEVNRPELASG